MNTRGERDQEEAGSDNGTQTAVRTTEFLRRAAAPLDVAQNSSKGEERISVFWRIFGGTLLSISALVVITAYQQIAGTFAELRKDVNRLTEGRADLVRSDDLANRVTSIWNGIKELQTANANVLALKERSSLLEQQLKTSHEQLTVRLGGLGNNLKELETANTALLALKERLSSLEQQLKMADEERKELNRELQRLRERQAALEGRQQVAAPLPAPGNRLGSGHK